MQTPTQQTLFFLNGSFSEALCRYFQNHHIKKNEII